MSAGEIAKGHGKRIAELVDNLCEDARDEARERKRLARFRPRNPSRMGGTGP